MTRIKDFVAVDAITRAAEKAGLPSKAAFEFAMMLYAGVNAAEAVEVFSHAAKRVEAPAAPPTELETLTEIAMGWGLPHPLAFVLGLSCGRAEFGFPR